MDFQGAYSALQLAQNIQQAHQILLCLLQPPLGICALVAEARDSRRLFKQFPTVLILGRNNRIDLALTHQRIAVGAQARVHKQLANVLAPHLLAVDLVLALAAAVIAAGDGDNLAPVL